MLLFAFLQTSTKLSKVATMLVFWNDFPMFPWILSAAIKVGPFSKYFIVTGSGPHVITHCARQVKRY